MREIDWITKTRKIWYCTECGETWWRIEDPEFKILSRCGFLMKPAEVSYYLERPDPDPLEILLDGCS